MGQITMIVTDHGNVKCQVKKCDYKATDVLVTITKFKADIQRYCWEHKGMMKK